MKAFLSHNGENKDLVNLVHQKLNKENAWFDSVDIVNGEKIPEKISEGIKVATHFILFWSNGASKSNWVEAELNAAFVRMMSDKCKFMIFRLDNTELPILLQPYKYENIDCSDLDSASEKICSIILAQGSLTTSFNSFVNRTKEIGDIESAIRSGIKLIVLNGILGIGKSSLAKRACEWIYGNYTSNILIDFYGIPGMGELVIAIAKLTKIPIPYENQTLDMQQKNLRYYFELISSKNMFIILKDIKDWLTDEGEPNQNLYFLIDLIINTNIFKDMPVIMTTSRFVSIPYRDQDKVKQLRILGMEDIHIATILKGNMPMSFMDYDNEKNSEFSKLMCGYPLGAKLGAYVISNFGYNYYLKQPAQVKQLRIGLAKQLISYAKISDNCRSFLEIVALVQSRFRNSEYAAAFGELSPAQISEFTNEGFFAGILKIDDDGCYKLEHIVEDYYNDLAFNSSQFIDRCRILEEYLMVEIKKYESDTGNYFRLLPIVIRILTLNGKTAEAMTLRSEMVCTIVHTMWDQYNHREYENALQTANNLLEISTRCIDALYIKALCYIRFERYAEATEILDSLKASEPQNPRYDNSLGRIDKYQERYELAICHFKDAIQKSQRFISSYREVSECFLYLNDIAKARYYINKAKEIDDTNIFVLLIECRILQKEGKGDEALSLIDGETILNEDPSQIMFRRGRIYDELGNTETAIQCYQEALNYNRNQVDAQLCLLNHNISRGIDCSHMISNLEKNLRGKRKSILINIKARYIGYYGNDIDEALSLLQTVPAKHRDKQWYAVKIQLMEKSQEKYFSEDRLQLSEKIKRNIVSIMEEFFQKYNEDKVSDASLLPDA